MRRASFRPRGVYDRLSPADRFRVAVMALGRYDFAEYRYLISNAPHSTVVTLHTEMREPFEELRSITWCFRSGAAGPIAQLKLLDGLAAAVREVYGALPQLAGLAEAFAELLELARSAPASELRTWMDAYMDITTERFGLTEETMLAIQHPQLASPLERYRELLEAAEPDPDEYVAVRAELEDSMRPADLADLEEAG